MASHTSTCLNGQAAPAVPTGDRVVLVLMIVLLAVQISPWYYSQPDAPEYLSIARNISHGALQGVGSPVLAYAPGFPLILSPLFRLRDVPLLEISVVQWLLAVAFLLGTYRWARLLTAEGAVWIAAISAGTCPVWSIYRKPMSEMAFMAVMAWLLVSLQALARRQSLGRYFAWLAAAVGLTIMLCLTRYVGAAIAAGGSCALLANAVRSRLFPKRSGSDAVSWWSALGAAILVGAAGVITVVGLIYYGHWVARVSGGETYFARLEAGGGAEILNDIGPWLSLVVSEVSRDTVPFMCKSYGYIGWWWDINMLVYVPWFAMLLFGYYRWMRQGDDPLAWSLPFYFAVLSHYHSESGGRWWLPMTPTFFMCVWFAVKEWRGRRRLLQALWLAHVLTALGYWVGCDLPRARRLDQHWPAARSLADRIVADRDRVVAAEKLDDLRELFMLQFDRRVGQFRGESTIPSSARWLIISAEDPPPAGFVEKKTCASLKCCSRAAP